MSKRWMGIVVLVALFSVPAAYAGGSESSGSFFEVIRDILSRVSAMIPPTGLEGDGGATGGNP